MDTNQHAHGHSGNDPSIGFSKRTGNSKHVAFLNPDFTSPITYNPNQPLLRHTSQYQQQHTNTDIAPEPVPQTMNFYYQAPPEQQAVALRPEQKKGYYDHRYDPYAHRRGYRPHTTRDHRYDDYEYRRAVEKYEQKWKEYEKQLEEYNRKKKDHEHKKELLAHV